MSEACLYGKGCKRKKAKKLNFSTKKFPVPSPINSEMKSLKASLWGKNKESGDSPMIELDGDGGGDGDGNSVLQATGVENHSMCKSLSFKKVQNSEKSFKFINSLENDGIPLLFNWSSSCHCLRNNFIFHPKIISNFSNKGLVLLFTKKQGAAFGVLYTGGTILSLLAWVHFKSLLNF